jgi:hypothetical protein
MYNLKTFCFRLGLAYAGSNREDVLALILPVLGDTKCTMEVNIVIRYYTFH